MSDWKDKVDEILKALEKRVAESVTELGGHRVVDGRMLALGAVGEALRVLAERVEAHEAALLEKAMLPGWSTQPVSALDEYADALDAERLKPGIEFAVAWLRQRVTAVEERAKTLDSNYDREETRARIQVLRAAADHLEKGEKP